MMTTETNPEAEPELELKVEDPEVQVEVEPEAEVESPEDPKLVALREELATEKRARQDAEDRASSLAAEKSTTDNRLASEVTNRFAAQEQAIDSRIKAAETGLATAKAEMIRANQEARFEDAANFAEQIADNKLELRAAGWEKNNLAQLKERAARTVEPPQQSTEDAFLARIPGAPSKQWLRGHPEILKAVATNPNGREAKRLFGAAQSAEGEGIAPDSPEYFEFIETRLGLKTEEEPVPQPKPAARQPGRTAAAAPSSRTAPSNSQRVVKLDDIVRKLTPNDRQNAKISFPNSTQDEAEKLFAEGLVKSKQREPNFRPDIRLN